jgi:purine/pyrimidine-nucleoside phosphorylase
MSSISKEISGVTAVTKANIYFDGKVASHSLFLADGTKKTLGIIYPGKYHFNTDKPEAMEIVAGECAVKIDGQTNKISYVAGQVFELPGKSGFEIEVKSGLCEYICTFLS